MTKAARMRLKCKRAMLDDYLVLGVSYCVSL